MARVRGPLLAVAQDPDPAPVGAEPGQVLAHRFRAALAAAILLRGGLGAFGDALVLRALLSLRAILVLLALRLGLAGIAHADGPGLLRALGIVSALAADAIDADLGVPAAVVVVAALRVGGRLGTAEEQDQCQGSEPSHVRALTTARRTVKEAHRDE